MALGLVERLKVRYRRRVNNVKRFRQEWEWQESTTRAVVVVLVDLRENGGVMKTRWKRAFYTLKRHIQIGNLPILHRPSFSIDWWVYTKRGNSNYAGVHLWSAGVVAALVELEEVCMEEEDWE